MKTDKNLILRAKLIALGVFIVASAGILVYGGLYEMPRRKCEANGGWWSNKYRSCETPVYLPLLTGRKAGEPRKIIWPNAQEAGRASNASKPVDPNAASNAAPNTASTSGQSN